jgi:hypothetical protein
LNVVDFDATKVQVSKKRKKRNSGKTLLHEVRREDVDIVLLHILTRDWER